jgi:hypothetical protein
MGGKVFLEGVKPLSCTQRLRDPFQEDRVADTQGKLAKT